MKIQFRIWHILVATVLAAAATVYSQHRHHQSKLDQEIDQLGLSLRATNCLIYDDVETVRDLIEKNEDQLLAIRNMGETTVVEISNKMKEMGLELKTSQ
jgi:DNA-directed RNA polymerase subunit alpha